MTIPGASNGALEVGGAMTPHTTKVMTTKLSTTPSPASEAGSNIDIIDIRQDAVEINLKDEIFRSLRPGSGPKTMPTLLLYDERGLQIFEEVHYRAFYKKKRRQITN